MDREDATLISGGRLLHLLTLMSFKTFMALFLWWNTKENIVKNVKQILYILAAKQLWRLLTSILQTINKLVLSIDYYFLYLFNGISFYDWYTTEIAPPPNI